MEVIMEKTHVCNKCGGTAKPSKALRNYHYLNKSYLRGEKEFETKLIDCVKCTSCGHSWVPPVMNADDLLKSRSIALKWWNEFILMCEYNDTHHLINNIVSEFFKDRTPKSLTGREIEIIWKAKSKLVSEDYLNEALNRQTCITTDQILKSEKEFDENRFRLMVKHYSKKDLLKALQVITDVLNQD